MLTRAAAPRGAGVAVGGQHQHSEGSGASAGLVFLPAHGDYAFLHFFLSYFDKPLTRCTSHNWTATLFCLLLQTKSMSHHLFLTSKLDIPRRQRFPDRFVDDIAALVCAISADIAGRYHKVCIP